MSGRILLLRHGRPNLSRPYHPIPTHYRVYDQALVDPSLPPPKNLLQQITQVTKCICSPLPRALSSLDMLLPRVKPIISDLFREAPLPEIPKPGIIPLPLWLIFLRGRWIQGHYSSDESYSECQERADKASDFLLGHIETDSPILLMGHGFFNHLLSQSLQEKGWEQTHSDQGYWSWRTLISF